MVPSVCLVVLGQAEETKGLAPEKHRWEHRGSHNLKTVVGAEFECALIDHLRGHYYPAPPVERMRDGSISVQVEGILHMVTRLMPGRAYDPGDAARCRTARGGPVPG